jgi:hypothetical protein
MSERIPMTHPDLKGDEAKYVAITEAQAAVLEEAGWKRDPKSSQSAAKS